jgi:hypothetical protein
LRLCFQVRRIFLIIRSVDLDGMNGIKVKSY